MITLVSICVASLISVGIYACVLLFEAMDRRDR